VDGQPNDHLGWIWSRHHRFEHRRQVLRGCANTHPNADTYCDGNTNCYFYHDTYSEANAHTQTRPNAKASSHTGASPNGAINFGAANTGSENAVICDQ
jgi:hypothetical protein